MGRIEELSFSELVQELTHYEHESGPPDLEKAIRRRSIDARLMSLLCNDVPVDERRASVRVPGDMPVRIFVGERALAGTVVDIGEGGLRVHLSQDGFDSDVVEVELGAPEHHARASARVTWKKPRAEGIDLGLHFQTQDAAHKRRLRRLVVEMLRLMPDPTTASS